MDKESKKILADLESVVRTVGGYKPKKSAKRFDNPPSVADGNRL